METERLLFKTDEFLTLFMGSYEGLIFSFIQFNMYMLYVIFYLILFAVVTFNGSVGENHSQLYLWSHLIRCTLYLIKKLCPCKYFMFYWWEYVIVSIDPKLL